jgi:hypothetical protein
MQMGNCWECGTYIGNAGVLGRCNVCHQTKVMKDIERDRKYAIPSQPAYQPTYHDQQPDYSDYQSSGGGYYAGDERVFKRRGYFNPLTFIVILFLIFWTSSLLWISYTDNTTMWFKYLIGIDILGIFWVWCFGTDKIDVTPKND